MATKQDMEINELNDEQEDLEKWLEEQVRRDASENRVHLHCSINGRNTVGPLF